MDAVKFLKERKRMCSNYERCVDCQIVGMCYARDDFDVKKAISAVEKWAKEHPIKTRLSEFLKQYPNARIGTDGLPASRPCDLEDRKCTLVCDECRKNYWLEEIE